MQKTKFLKHLLHAKQHIQWFYQHGLIIKAPQQAIECLQSARYYRLSAYCKPVEIKNRTAHFFKKLASFACLRGAYVFDRTFRWHVMHDVIARLEMAIRTTLSNTRSHHYGWLGYLAAKPFANPWFEDAGAMPHHPVGFQADGQNSAFGELL